ncbi:MAG: FAD-dependent oxidoreductase [Desulfobulbaceae bacterium]
MRVQPEKHSCEVLVAGGGVAGVAAAVGAARSGARVLLVERYGFMGGMAAAALVSTICGLYPRSGKGNPEPLPGGFAAEVAARIGADGAAQPLELSGGLHVLPCAPWRMVRLADRLVREEKIGVLLHACISTVVCENTRVVEVRGMAWDRPVVIRPASVVDCTGEANLAALAGGETLRAGGQDASVLFRVNGLDAGEKAQRVALVRRIVRAAEQGVLPESCRNLTFAPGPVDTGSGLLQVPLAAVLGETATDLELRGREVIEQVVCFLERELPPSLRPEFPVQVGIRSGRRAAGRETLSVSQVLAGGSRPDGVARGCWPVEIWRGGRRPEVRHLPEGAWYEISAGCLTAAGLDNVFMAGRCISADEEALASARVIGTALETGFGAGVLAAFQALGRPREAAITFVRNQWAGDMG